MKLDAHCQRCTELLGAPFRQVHQWIDQFAWINNAHRNGAVFNPEHRRHRHNLVGIQQAREIFGEKGAEAAKLHVLDDLYGPGEHGEGHVIPRDEKDFLRMKCH